MNSFVSELVAGIKIGDDEAILGACEIADAFHIRNFQPVPPYDDRLRANPPNAEDISVIKFALIEHLESARTPGSRVYAALGKLRDPSLIPMLREHLALTLKTLLEYNGAIANLIMALDRSGEKIVVGTYHSPFQPEKMIADARAYLKQFGQLFPW